MAQVSSSVGAKAGTDFIPDLERSGEQAPPNTKAGRRVKRVIHCSDGVYEEYSSDEDGVYQVANDSTLVDPKSMTWIPWIGHLSSKALAACDYVGESIADFLGITSPKYLYEIEEANRMKAEEEARKKASDLEMAGWATKTQSQDESNVLKTSEPQSSTPVSILSIREA